MGSDEIAAARADGFHQFISWLASALAAAAIGPSVKLYREVGEMERDHAALVHRVTELEQESDRRMDKIKEFEELKGSATRLRELFDDHRNTSKGTHERMWRAIRGRDDGEEE